MLGHKTQSQKIPKKKKISKMPFVSDLTTMKQSFKSIAIDNTKTCYGKLAHYLMMNRWTSEIKKSQTHRTKWKWKPNI